MVTSESIWKRVNDEAVLIFTANSREKNFDEMKQEFEQIMETVEIER